MEFFPHFFEIYLQAWHFPFLVYKDIATMYPLQQCIHCNNVPTVAMQSLLQCTHHSNVFIATMYPPQQRIHCGNVSATAIYLSQKWIHGRIHGRNVPTAAMGPLQQQHIPWSHRMVKDCTPHSEAPQTERTPQHRGTCQVTVGCSETQLRHVFLTHCQSQAREQRHGYFLYIHYKAIFV